MRPCNAPSLQPRRQRGAVMILFVVGMVAMLAVAGLVIDGSHGMLSKSRLQNVVDAAALSSAKTLDISGGDEDLALAEALDMFADNAAESGHKEIAERFNSGELIVQVEFSSTLDPFAPGTIPADYVRVTATGLDLPTWLARIVGIDEMTVGASAVAGPSPTLASVCNVAPIMVCGDDNGPSDPYYGYTPGDVEVLKTSAGNGGTFEVGPGNFQLIRLEGNTGGADIRTSLAGGYAGCVTPNEGEIPTEPGNTIGPVAQGLNTRLGLYAGPLASAQDTYPPDKVLIQTEGLTYEDGVVYYQGQANPGQDDLPLDNTYEYYLENVMDSMAWGGEYDEDGVPFRRVLRLPVGNCDGTTNGAGNVPMLGVLCFYLLKEVSQKGNEAEIFGQFMGDDATCPVTGKPGPAPMNGPGPYTIQLYKDPAGGPA